jgi:hypothetical protein
VWVPKQEAVTAENAGERLSTRCERETLSRFPKTGAILFTIRTHQRQLKSFEGRPDKVGCLVGIGSRNFLHIFSPCCTRFWQVGVSLCLFCHLLCRSISLLVNAACGPQTRGLLPRLNSEKEFLCQHVGQPA